MEGWKVAERFRIYTLKCVALSCNFDPKVLGKKNMGAVVACCSFFQKVGDKVLMKRILSSAREGRGTDTALLQLAFLSQTHFWDYLPQLRHLKSGFRIFLTRIPTSIQELDSAFPHLCLPHKVLHV